MKRCFCDPIWGSTIPADRAHAIRVPTPKNEQTRLVGGWHGMMFVDDPPPAILFTKAHSQAELQLARNSVRCNVNAAADRSNKSHVLARCNLDVLKVENNWSHLRFVEQLPGIHVCVESTRGQRRWNIEH